LQSSKLDLIQKGKIQSIGARIFIQQFYLVKKTRQVIGGIALLEICKSFKVKTSCHIA
jgi:hypothetical protein